MSYGINTVTVHKKLRLDKRYGSDNWYARLTLDNGKRVIKSTKTDDLADAKLLALKMYFETQARIENNLPAQTRKFKHVAEFAIKRMQEQIDQGTGKQAYKDYISALHKWLIKYFGTTDIDKIDLASLTSFDVWRTKRNKKQFSQSGINNHNSALNRVFDEAELHGWMTKSMRPTLLNKGVKSESRGSFTAAEHQKIYTALRSWHRKTQHPQAAATREVLRNYVLFLANTGVRHGTEALNLRWYNIDWHQQDGEKYLVINVDGKTKKRSAVARDTVTDYLDRQRKLNPLLLSGSFDELLASKSEEFVFTSRLGMVATVHNLNRAFNPLLEHLGLKTGADKKTRTLYSYRHYYATRDLNRGISTHALSKQMGNSTAMIDKHYSKYSTLINAELHSGRNQKKQVTAVPLPETKTHDSVTVAFDMVEKGELTEELLLAAIGVDRENYSPVDSINLRALMAKKAGVISEEALRRIMKG